MSQIPGKINSIINLNELLFDIIVAVFAFIVMQIFIPEGRPMILELGPEGILFLVFFLQFFVAVYLGVLFGEFRSSMERSRVVKNLIRFFFGITVNGMFLILLITFALYVEFPGDYFGRETNLLIVFILSVPLIMGFFLGSPVDLQREMMPILWMPFGVFIPMLFYTCLVIGWKVHWFLGLLSFPLLVALVAAPLVGKKYLTKKVDISKRMKKGLSLLCRDIVFPALMAVAFIYWQELTIMGVFKSASNNNITVSMTHLYLALALGGLIPIRLVMAVTPPFKPANVFMGVIAFVLYIISVSGYIHFQVPGN